MSFQLQQTCFLSFYVEANSATWCLHLGTGVNQEGVFLTILGTDLF